MVSELVQPQDDETQRLTISWRETGGPPVTSPERRGFGTRLIEQGFVTQHDGKAVLDYRPDGLVCDIDLAIPMAPTTTVFDKSPADAETLAKA